MTSEVRGLGLGEQRLYVSGVEQCRGEVWEEETSERARGRAWHGASGRPISKLPASPHLAASRGVDYSSACKGTGQRQRSENSHRLRYSASPSSLETKICARSCTASPCRELPVYLGDFSHDSSTPSHPSRITVVETNRRPFPSHSSRTGLSAQDHGPLETCSQYSTMCC